MSDGADGPASVVQGAGVDRLTSTSEVISEIARATDLQGLLQAAAEGARNLVGVHQASATRIRQSWSDAETYVSLSDKYAAYRTYDEVPRGLGLPAYVAAENQVLRLSGDELVRHPAWQGLDAPGHPPLPDYLAAPFEGRSGGNLGLIQVSDKVDGSPFTEADEGLLVQIATTAAGVVEHLELAVELERNVRKHQLVADVAVAFASTGALGDMLRRTAKAVVDHLDAPLARIWLVNQDLDQLELHASSGSVTAITGPEMRIGIGEGVIGGIAAVQKPYTADAFDELSDVWIADDRSVAFAGLPLMLEGRCIGVLCMSTSRPLTANAMTALQATAETAALGIERVRQERTTTALLARERRIRNDLDHALRRVDLMHTIGRGVLRRIDVDEIVKMVIEAAVELTPASFGAFFYNISGDDDRAQYDLYRLAGVDADAFRDMDMPRATTVFAPTFNGERIVRSDDITQDPGFGREAPHFGLPGGHPPVRSYLAVPVRLSSTDVVGGMLFAHPDPGRFSENDETIVSALADYAGIAIDNARLLNALELELDERSRILEERDRVANVLQASLLPPTLPDIPNVDLGAAYQGGQTSVGGDFYDMFPLADDDWFIVLGDVCGKGAMAAARTAVARHSVRTGALLRRQPDAALRVLNQALLIDESQDQRSRFVSAIALRIRFDEEAQGVLDVDAATGGHHPPLIRRVDGTIETLEVAGTILGVFEDPKVGVASARLEPGDQVVLFTDGVIEASRSDGEVYGTDRLVDLLRSNEPRSAAELAEAIRREATAFADSASRDDIAVVVVGTPV